MSGTKVDSTSLETLQAVLDRDSHIDSLACLREAISSKSQKRIQLKSTAIGIDSSVFLRLAKHDNRETLFDYLRTEHTAPLILPGQAVQEYWKNQHSAIPPLAKDIKTKFEQLKSEVLKLDEAFGEYASEMQTLLDRFESEYGYIYDSATNRHAQALIEVLEEKADLIYVPRTRFDKIATNRKRSKTPPGFKDDGDGDFYIWVEYLYGLLQAKKNGKAFDHAILLTNDTKKDWSSSGIAHPVLAAEVQLLVGVPFEVLTAEQLYSALKEATTTPSDSPSVE